MGNYLNDISISVVRCSGDDDTAVKYFLLSGITVTEMLQTHKENNIRKVDKTYPGNMRH